MSGDDSAERELKSLCKLFIGGIPRSITDEQLAEHFLQFTEDDQLNDCVVIKDDMKNSRGFGFVTYNTLADTDKCLANRPHNLGDKEVEVKHAIPRDEKIETNHCRTNKIFVGGLPKDATEEEIINVIQNHVLKIGENLNAAISKVDIIKDKESGEPRGFAFLDMASEDDADKVVIVKHFEISGRRVELKKAEPRGEGGAGNRRGGGGRGGRGGRGARGGGRGMSQYGGMSGGGWGGGNQFGSTANSFGAGAYGAGGYGFGGYDSFGGGYGQFQQQASNYGPARTNGRYGPGGGRNAPY